MTSHQSTVQTPSLKLPTTPPGKSLFGVALEKVKKIKNQSLITPEAVFTNAEMSQSEIDMPESQAFTDFDEEVEIDEGDGAFPTSPKESDSTDISHNMPRLSIKAGEKIHIGQDARNVVVEISERFDYVLISKESRYATNGDETSAGTSDVEEVVQRRWIKLFKEQCDEIVADIETLKLGVHMLQDGKAPEYRSMLGELVQMVFSPESEQFCDIRKYYYREKEYKRTQVGVCLLASEADHVLDIVYNVAPRMKPRTRNVLVSKRKNQPAENLIPAKRNA